MDDSITLIRQAIRWHSSGEKVALGTVINTWGSAPRRIGSMICINGNREFQGSVSGGCVEGAVISQALEVIQSGQPERMEFGVSNEQAWEVGLACGGKIEVWIEAVTPMLAQDLKYLLELAVHEKAAVLVKTLEEDCKTRAFSLTDLSMATLPGVEIEQTARQSLRQDRSKTIETNTGQVFFQPFNPELKLYIVGAVHISQHLAPLAQQAGFDVRVIDPRQAFATQARFPGITLIRKWPEEVFAEHALNHRCAVVTLTHDPKFDDPAIVAALASNIFYIGALGSRSTHAGRIQRLIGQGITEKQLSRIHAPIGLDIGASNPVEISISIIAELVQQLRIHE